MPQDIYDKIFMLAKRRGFIYPSFEIYGGVAGFYDYGPLGPQLKLNIENLWRNYFLLKDICVEISTPTITLFEVLKSSGHVDEFTDLTVDCKKCNQSYKVEELIDEETNINNAIEKNKIKCPNCKAILKDAYPVNLMFSTKIGIGKSRDAFLRPETAQGIFTDFHLLYRYCREKLPFGVIQVGRGFRNEVSPRQGIIRLREFSMAEAEIFFDPNDKAHPNFESVKENELFLFDNKKEIKISLKKAVSNNVIKNQALAYYMYLTQDFLMNAGVDPKKFRFRKHSDDELAHYASECWDAELFSERFGWIECVGIADRSAYDLKSHIDSSGTDMYAIRKFEKPTILNVKKIIPDMGKLGPLFKGKAGKIKNLLEDLEVKNEKEITLNLEGEQITIPEDCYKIIEKKEKISGEKFVPHVIEPSYGIDRILYCLLEHNFEEGTKKGEEYTILKFNSKIAPITVGIFPLINNEKLSKIAQNIDNDLRNKGIRTYYDMGGSIGRRYARMDEVGTPYCITVDHDSLLDDTITIRERDTTKQVRIKIDEISNYLNEKIN
jgi:glycyl-tRNA synthetase